MNTCNQRLVGDLKHVAEDVEIILKQTAGDVSEKARLARERLAETLQAAKETCCQLEGKAVEGAKAADRTIRSHPYQAIGIALGCGVLLGVLLHRK